MIVDQRKNAEVKEKKVELPFCSSAKEVRKNDDL